MHVIHSLNPEQAEWQDGVNPRVQMIEPAAAAEGQVMYGLGRG